MDGIWLWVIGVFTIIGGTYVLFIFARWLYRLYRNKKSLEREIVTLTDKILSRLDRNGEHRVQ